MAPSHSIQLAQSRSLLLMVECAYVNSALGKLCTVKAGFVNMLLKEQIKFTIMFYAIHIFKVLRVEVLENKF